MSSFRKEECSEMDAWFKTIFSKDFVDFDMDFNEPEEGAFEKSRWRK